MDTTPLQLPKMRTYDEALAFAKQTGDPFYLCAFKLTTWIRDLMAETLLTYNTPDHRPCDVLQDGLAWLGCHDLEIYRRDVLGLPPLQPPESQLPGPPAGLLLASKLLPANPDPLFKPF